jgi:hypothetical protein
MLHARRDFWYVLGMHAGSEDTPILELRFKVERADEIAAKHGLESIKDKAAFFGATETTYSRAARRLIVPGEVFITGVLAARPDDPDITFDALFELAPPPEWRSDKKKAGKKVAA